MNNFSLLSTVRSWASLLVVGGIACLSSFSSMAAGQTFPAEATKLEHPAASDCTLARLDRQLFVVPTKLASAGQQGQARIPRLAASLVGLKWLGQTSPDSNLSLKVDQDFWTILWTNRPAEAMVIQLVFDIPPRLMEEIPPVRAAGDGSIYLPASAATTVGEKIRYEPQTFKNTVGYWTGRQDTASWQFHIDAGGDYNVAILQGCGTGQGGSRAKLTLGLDGAQALAGELEFSVLETGHFQNFQWRHLGQIQITEAGLYQLRIEPIRIQKNALMDVRAVHLIKLP